jgi:hypothetical protein
MGNLCDCKDDSCPDCLKSKRIAELRDKPELTPEEQKELGRLSNELLGVV